MDKLTSITCVDTSLGSALRIAPPSSHWNVLLSAQELAFTVAEQLFALNGEVQIVVPGDTHKLRCGIIGVGWSM